MRMSRGGIRRPIIIMPRCNKEIVQLWYMCAYNGQASLIQVGIIYSGCVQWVYTVGVYSGHVYLCSIMLYKEIY